MNGMEIMLKSMGLGDVIEMAKGLADNGTLDKIVRFADCLDDLTARLDRIESYMEKMEHGSRTARIEALSGPCDVAANGNPVDGAGVPGHAISN